MPYGARIEFLSTLSRQQTRYLYPRGRSMFLRMGWVTTEDLGTRGLGTKTPLAHVITPPHPMVLSAVEVPDVDAIIDTLRPHPVLFQTKRGLGSRLAVTTA
jgi:hypothetical protein